MRCYHSTLSSMLSRTAQAAFTHEDVNIMRTALYEQSSTERAVNHGQIDDIISLTAGRLYTEYCLQMNAEVGWKNYDEFDGQNYRKWIDDETHYAIERLRNNGLVITHQIYIDVHTKVIKAAILRAAVLLEEWDGSRPKNKDDNRNLQAPLTIDL